MCRLPDSRNADLFPSSSYANSENTKALIHQLVDARVLPKCRLRAKVVAAVLKKVVSGSRQRRLQEKQLQTNERQEARLRKRANPRSGSVTIIA
jgi:hypothetical protein